MLKRLLLVVAATSLAGSSLVAQETIRLQFELYRNGSLLAKPVVTVQDKEAGSLAMDGVAQLSFTPTRVATDKIAVAFDVVFGDKKFQPRIVLLDQEPGSLSWKSTSGTDSFEVRVTHLR